MYIFFQNQQPWSYTYSFTIRRYSAIVSQKVQSVTEPYHISHTVSRIFLFGQFRKVVRQQFVENFQIICKRRINFIVSIASVTFLLDFLLSLTIYDSIVKDAMCSVKFLTNLGNFLSTCLFLAPLALAPPLRFRTIRPQRLRLEKSPLQSQNIY